MGIDLTSEGNYDRTEVWLQKLKDNHIFDSLEKYGADGVAALSGLTPVDTGVASHSWDYQIQSGPGFWSLTWTNSDVIDDGTPVVVLLEYGHGTGTGGYVEGIDFIMPAINPIFDKLEAEFTRLLTE